MRVRVRLRPTAFFRCFVISGIMRLLLELFEEIVVVSDVDMNSAPQWLEINL
jgi:hypothetical protein